MLCPSCKTVMEKRVGKFGAFLFCPQQHVCKQNTITMHSEPVMRIPVSSIVTTSICLENSLQGMARMAYENAREHERTHDQSHIDPQDIAFGGMFCDMGMQEDDEDPNPW
jgi:ssDNA-binding Zn-finger/Zn-ribbon topoisomerase 1